MTGLTLGVSILDIMDVEAAILSTSEKVVVIEANSHSLDWEGVSLDFADSVHLECTSGLVLGDLVNDD